MTEKDKELFELQRKVEELEERIAIMTEGKPEIVMCKDCKHSYVSPCSSTGQIWCCGRKHILTTVKPNFYCADGERKVDNG